MSTAEERRDLYLDLAKGAIKSANVIIKEAGPTTENRDRCLRESGTQTLHAILWSIAGELANISMKLNTRK